MALQKQTLEVKFGAGVDTKTDPWQVAGGKFLALENAVFNKGGLFSKRNGFGDITTLPTNADVTSLTTLNGSLVGTGSQLYAYSNNTGSWITQGTVQPIALSAQALVRGSSSQSAPDAVVSSTNLVCTVYVENSLCYYQVSDSITGQLILPRVALPATATNPRVFLLRNYFVITFVATVAATPHLQYIALSAVSPTSAPTAATDLSTQIVALTSAYDGFVANDRLYLAWNANDGGGAVRTLFLSGSLVVSATQVWATETAACISVTADTSGSSPVVYVSWFDSVNSRVRVAVRDQNLLAVLAPTSVMTAVTANLVTSIAASGSVTVLVAITNTYSYSATRSDYVYTNTCTQAGVVGTASTLLRGVSLASKPFLFNRTNYVMVAYGGTYQPTYFLVNFSGQILAKVAYSNGGGYPTTQVLPSATVLASTVYVPYRYKDLLVSVNKAQGVPNVSGVYAQTGLNLLAMQINSTAQYSSEIADNLHLTGGILWQYDGVKPVEHGFHVWPEDIAVTTSGTGGSITAQQYYYAFCYEWTDAAGLLHRSAPSTPMGIVTTGATSSNTIKVPTLRFTYKTGNNVVRIVGYRWSTAQQAYYQFTSITAPTLNDTTADSVTFTDTLADSSILGNTLLYTTGGVVENIGAPACAHACLYKSRLVLLDAEDPNVLWYSKQVVQNTPVELSDLLTLYVAPSTGAQGSTGLSKAVFAMDDKLLVFKPDAIYYVTGTGPDATGSNNDFSEPTFITSAVGCSNPSSLVLTPQGVMFQSDKGIWLLGRDLSTRYIGADVENYNSATVLSALMVPGTNEVRFTLSSGVTLMYDYFYGQWCVFTGIPGISSTLYQGKHTYLSTRSLVRQEKPGKYLDGSTPVLIKFTTSWLKLAGLQGYQRAYWFQLLGDYLSPHTLTVQVMLNYNPSVVQTTAIRPTNYSGPYGTGNLYGSASPFGGDSSAEQWQVFFKQQRCQAVQVTISENYDSTLGVGAGAGLTLSGLNFQIGIKGGSYQTSDSNSVG